jgi:hypothetical protein
MIKVIKRLIIKDEVTGRIIIVPNGKIIFEVVYAHDGESGLERHYQCEFEIYVETRCIEIEILIYEKPEYSFESPIVINCNGAVIVQRLEVQFED